MNPNREFFKIEPDQAIAILKLLDELDATAEVAAQPTAIPAEEVQTSTNYKARRPNLNFAEMNIPVGSQLHFVDGDAVAFVSAPRKVTLNGEEMSLSAATRQLLALAYSVQPTPYWAFRAVCCRKNVGEPTSRTTEHTDCCLRGYYGE